MTCGSPSGFSVGFFPGLPVRIPHLYTAEQTIAWEIACLDVSRFIALPNHPGLLSISHDHHSWDPVAVAWSKS